MIAEAIFEHAASAPERTALEYNDEPWSYRRFAEAIASARGYLRARGLVGGGVVVLAVVDLRASWVFILALRSLGVTVAPIFAVHVIADLRLPEVRCVVSSAAEDWPGLAETCADRGYELIVASPAGAPPLDVAATAEATGGHILLTSGTTGRSKKVLMDPAFEAEFLRRRQAAVPASRETVANLFNFGAWTGLGYRAPAGVWLEGGIVAFNQGRPPHLALLRPGLSSSPGLPGMLAEILDLPEGAFPRSETMDLRIGGGTVTQAQLEACRRRITPRLFNALACTETQQISMTPVQTLEDYRWHVLVPTTKVEIVDELDQPVAIGQIGRLRVGTEGGPTGYLHDEEATQAFFTNGFFYPGDLAVMRKDGRIALQGRVTDVINVQGQKISPAPIEDRLRETLGVAGLCLLSMQDDHGEEELHLVIEAPRPLDTAVLASTLRAVLSGFRGVHVRYTPALPRNEAGKILRQALTAEVFAERR